MALIIAVLGPLEISQLILAEWAALADEARRPHSAPAWALAWAAHVMASSQEFRLITVHDGSRLLGVLPLSTGGGRLATPGGGLITVEPLARPGHEERVGAAFGEAIAGLGARGSVLELEYEDGSPDWKRLLGRGGAGEGEPRLATMRTTPVMRLELGAEGFDGWFSAKSSNFRRDVNRKAHRLEREGATLRSSDPATLADDLAAFARLHRARHPRGTSLSAPGVEGMLREIGESELASGKFRLVCIDSAGETEAALLLAAAGGEVSAWASGHSERLARHSPLLQCFVAALREMDERGERHLNLGPGNQDYKLRLASGQGQLESVTMVPPGAGSMRARTRIVLRRARGGADRGLRRCGRAVKRFAAPRTRA